MEDKDFLYGQLTRQIIDIANAVYEELHYGHPEKVYQKAFEYELEKLDFKFKRESYSKIQYDGKVVGRYFLDFLIDNKIAVEIKVRREIYESDWIQLLNYLKANGLKVGLLIIFMKYGVKIKRVVN